MNERTDQSGTGTAVSDDAPHVLVVDDDKRIRDLLARFLLDNGYRVSTAEDAAVARASMRGLSFDLLILDIMMPGETGLSLAQDLRTHSQVPILMLTARTDAEDRIAGLEIGADDYLPKTFSTRELLARIRAVMRRSILTARQQQPAEAPPVWVGGLWIDPATHTASLDGSPLTLTPIEFDMLLSLARSAGRVKSREQLLLEIAERDFEAFDRSIDVHISALRKKLGDDPKSPRYIETVRGAGYRLRRPDSEPLA